jgi:hypothetical protein
MFFMKQLQEAHFAILSKLCIKMGDLLYTTVYISADDASFLGIHGIFGGLLRI